MLFLEAGRENDCEAEGCLRGLASLPSSRLGLRLVSPLRTTFPPAQPLVKILFSRDELDRKMGDHRISAPGRSERNLGTVEKLAVVIAVWVPLPSCLGCSTLGLRETMNEIPPGYDVGGKGFDPNVGKITRTKVPRAQVQRKEAESERERERE